MPKLIGMIAFNSRSLFIYGINLFIFSVSVPISSYIDMSLRTFKVVGSQSSVTFSPISGNSKYCRKLTFVMICDDCSVTVHR